MKRSGLVSPTRSPPVPSAAPCVHSLSVCPELDLSVLTAPALPPPPAPPPGLETVQLNSSLGLRAKLLALHQAQFHPHGAVQESLARSERTKNLINTRATKVVNVCRRRPLFADLVSVDVQVDALLCQVTEGKPRPLSQVDWASDGPSRLLFMSSDLLRQKPRPLGEEPGGGEAPPLTSPPTRSTFDLCRKQRQWEATP